MKLRLGSQTLTRCRTAPLAYCGTLAVALDHTVASGPQITIAYRWYPASAPHGGRPAGTVVPVEGGPGYPSTGSVAGGYSVMYGALLERWNMLAVDNRGTGRSSPLRCPALQGFSGPTASEAFQQAAGGCAAALNHRWRYADGSPVHGSDMFSTAPAAEDLAAVIGALGISKVDLYGDSYGSFFAQVFAARYPRLV
ncbi:MAG TPA: alpha/beta fold hydrolase, partial [Solirubrobacteraceae bacterium]